MTRKPGITILSFVMWFYAISIISGIVWLSNSETNIDTVVSILVIISGTIAGATAYGLWTLKEWAYRGLIIFIFSSLITTVFNYLPKEANEFHWSVWLLLLLANVFLVCYILFYVKNNININSN